MNAIARTIRTRIPLVSFSTRSFFIFLGIVALVLLVVFLPEISGIHVRRAMDEARQEAQPARDASPLELVLERINEINQRKPFAPTNRELASQALYRDGVTWDTVRSEPVRAALTQARAQVTELITMLPEEKTFSRFALANYRLALDQLMSAKEELFSADKALGYIRHLDEEVSRKMADERVDPTLFKRWSQISLGDALQTAQNRPFREGFATTYDPDLSINNVSLHRILPGTKLKVSNFMEKESMTIQGSLIAPGTARLRLYRNGKYIQDVSLPHPRRRAQDNHVFFTVDVTPIDGVITLRAESVDGEAFSKSYSFFPKVLWLADNQKQTDFRLGAVVQRVPALDRYFLVGQQSPSSKGDGMVAF